MNTGLWIVQGPLALLFLLAGGMKVFAFSRFKRRAAERSPEKGLGYSRPLGAFIGLSELAGSVGLVLAQASGTAPWLTPLAAAGRAVIMILAAVHHWRRGERVVGNVVLLTLALVVAVGRWI